MPVTDGNGYIVATTGVIAGHHNDSYELEQQLKRIFADMKRCGLDYRDAIFNMDSSFDTRAARKLLQYGPISILALWEAAYEAPIYLVTNMVDLDAAFALYQQRAQIETFFSDQKSRGFHLHKSHLSDPQRLSRLLIAACLAYLWIVYLGVCALRDDWLKRLHRRDRCDLSLFRLGLRLLARCLKDELPIPPGFLVPAIPPSKPVRHALRQAA